MPRLRVDALAAAVEVPGFDEHGVAKTRIFKPGLLMQAAPTVTAPPWTIVRCAIQSLDQLRRVLILLLPDPQVKSPPRYEQ